MFVSLVRSSVDRCVVTTSTVCQTAGHAANRGNAYAGQVVDLPVGKVFLQVFDDLPSIDKGLKFSGGAEVFEKRSDLGRIFQGDQGSKKGIFCAALFSFRFVSIGFHDRTNVLMY